MDVLTRDRRLRLLGIELGETRAAKPSQAAKPMHVDVADANEAEVHTPEQADAQYGAELDRVDLYGGVSVVARAHGLVTIESDVGGGQVAVHAAPSPQEAHDWADYIDSGLDLTDGETTHEHDLTVVRTADGLLLRWPEGDETVIPEEADGVDLSDVQVPAFTQALRDMADLADEEGAADLTGPAEEQDMAGAAGMMRHRQLQLLGVEVRAYNPAKHPHYGKGVAEGKGGQFRPIAQQIMDALLGAGDSGGDPLAGFSQPQLRKAAEQLGLNPPKGMRLVPLKGLLIAHGRGEHPHAPHAPGAVASDAKAFTDRLKAIKGPDARVKIRAHLEQSSMEDLASIADELGMQTQPDWSSRRHIADAIADHIAAGQSNTPAKKVAEAARESVLGGPMDEYEAALHRLTAIQIKRVAEELNIPKPARSPWPVGKEARIRYTLNTIDDARRRSHSAHSRDDIAKAIESLGFGGTTPTGGIPAKKAAAKAVPHAASWNAPGAPDQLAAAFHEQWRQSRLQPGGKFEPRVKTTKDKAWITKHGTDQVDIANTSYNDLPDDWKAENKAAADVVVGLLRQHGNLDLSNQANRDKIGSAIHDEWLKRNEYARGGELDVPFGKLSKEEQDKDIAQYETALTVFGSSKKATKAAAGTAATDVARMTVPQLRAHAKANGIPTGGATKKADLLAAIHQHQGGAPEVATADKFAAGAHTGQAALDAAPFMDDVPKTMRAAGLPEWVAIAAELELKRYKGSTFGPTNKYLQGQPLGDTATGEAKRALEGLDAAFGHSLTSSDVVVYRGDKGDKGGIARYFADGQNITLPPGASVDGNLEGAEWVAPAFQSTSVNADMADRFSVNVRPDDPLDQPTVMRIRVPKGTPAVSLNREAESVDPDNRSEAEIVLGRGLRYRVVKDYGVDAKGVRRLDVEVVTPTGGASPTPKATIPPAVTTRVYAHQLTPDDAIIWTDPQGVGHEVQIRSQRIRNVTMPDGQPGLEMDVEGTGGSAGYPQRTIQLGINQPVQRVDKRATAAGPAHADTSPAETLHRDIRGPIQLARKTRAEIHTLLDAQNLTDAEAIQLAKDWKVPGARFLTTRNDVIEKMANLYGSDAPRKFDPDNVAAALSKLKTEAEIHDRLANFGLTAALLRRLARNYQIVLPTDLKGRDAIQRHIAASIARDVALRVSRALVMDAEARERMLATATRALGHDITPGHDQLHHYWTRDPEGLARWVHSPTPWRTLLANLQEEVHDKPLEVLEKWVSRWFIEVFHYAAGSDKNRVAHGHKPRGKLVGPG